MHPGDPYDLLVDLASVRFRRPTAAAAVEAARTLGVKGLTPPPPPPQEALPRWRRVAEGLRHSMTRDAEAISHHYDVSNRFYEMVLGPSMTYTCACYPDAAATLEQAQDNKYRLVLDKLGLRPGDRLLDIGCGWGGMVRYAARHGIRVLGVTLSRQQAAVGPGGDRRRGAGRPRRGASLPTTATSRGPGSTPCPRSGSPSTSGCATTRPTSGGSATGCAPAGCCSTTASPGRTTAARRPGTSSTATSSPTASSPARAGSSPRRRTPGSRCVHEENLREHYALTLAQWCRNLVEHWDECVAEVGEGTARVWGLYMAGSRLGFERNEIQLHQVLALRPHDDGSTGLPLRPWWSA